MSCCMITPFLCDPRPVFTANGKTSTTASELTETSRIDLDAVCSVLQFGGIVPPLSPWCDVSRLVPRRRSAANRASSRVEALVAEPSPQQQVDRVIAALDEALLRLVGDNDRPVLLFSGGVDSGLLAARLVSLGRRPRLFNYAFGQNDPESTLAEAMATHLGLEIERILPDGQHILSLEAPGRLYPQPFGDHSVVPTSDLARQVMSRIDPGQVIIEGIGADGLFGLRQKIASWRRVYQLPPPLRKAAAFLLQGNLAGGRLEPIAKILKRSADLPMSAAIIAQNPFSGVAYAAAPRVRSAFSNWIGADAGIDADASIVLADLALTCANVFAQKDISLYERAGHVVALPFLDETLVESLVYEAPHWPTTEPKAPLKAALARQVPAEMVYRKKVGFAESRPKVFDAPEFSDYLQEAIEGPLSELLNQLRVRSMLSAVRSGDPIPAQTLNFLWSLTFTDRWYKTA